MLPFALLFEAAFWSAEVPEAFGSELLVAAEPFWLVEEELLDWSVAAEPEAAPV